MNMPEEKMQTPEVETSFHVVIVGHVDHGKSTLIGRLLYDTNSLSSDRLEEIKRISADMGREMEFAYVMDHLQEERQRNITIDIAYTFFKTPKRRYVIIDAPGHKEFLKNMISGSSQAHAALLLVDASRGVEEQTIRHSFLLSLLGVKQVAVLVNKMDLLEWSRDEFGEIRDSLLPVLERLEIFPEYILPISAKLGANVADSCEKLSWFDGPTVLEALDGFRAVEAQEKSLRFPVQDIYDVNGSALAVGRVESGVLKTGQEVFVLPEGKKARVTEIRQFLNEDVKSIPAGTCAGVMVAGDVAGDIEGSELRRGCVLADSNDTSAIRDSIHANIVWMMDWDYKLGTPVKWRCATQEIGGTIDKIIKRVDSSSLEVVGKDSSGIGPLEIAEVEIKLERPAVADSHANIPEMGRFVLEIDGHTVAGGIVL